MCPKIHVYCLECRGDLFYQEDSERHDRTCPARQVESELCGEQVKLNYLQSHQEGFCVDWDIVTCEFCHERKPIIHRLMCPEEVRDCDSCSIKVARKNWQEHKIECAQKRSNSNSRCLIQ